jgi:hypothetical protein
VVFFRKPGKIYLDIKPFIYLLFEMRPAKLWFKDVTSESFLYSRMIMQLLRYVFMFRNTSCVDRFEMRDIWFFQSLDIVYKYTAREIRTELSKDSMESITDI